MGVQVTRGRTALTGALACLLLVPGVRVASAADRYAVVVTGASGGPAYAEKYDRWRRAFVTILRDQFAYPDDHIVVLAEQEAPGVRPADRDHVRAALADLAGRVAEDDVVMIVLVGHGTAFVGEAPKFNLVGPDLSSAEWARLVAPIRGRLVFVNTTAGSYPFLRDLAAKGRIVVTATDATSQQFETSFPEFFLGAFGESGADGDKNGRVSIWEAFRYASARVSARFTEQGRLATERALLDDTGAGLGREADAEGPDGALAQVTFMQPERVTAAGAGDDPALGGLMARRSSLVSQLELLRASRASQPPAEYDAELERLLLELARLDRQLRDQP
jgi:hypothetical protein